MSTPVKKGSFIDVSFYYYYYCYMASPSDRREILDCLAPGFYTTTCQLQQGSVAKLNASDPRIS